MLALISPNENNRICQVEATDFPVAEPLFWTPCPDDCTTEWTYVDGQFVAPVPPVPVIPSEVSMRQARLALFQQGILNDVQPAIDGLSDPEKTVAQISWDYATTVQRDDDLVVALSGQLGLDDTDLDALFSLAATL